MSSIGTITIEINGTSGTEMYRDDPQHDTTTRSPTDHPVSPVIPLGLDAGQTLYWTQVWRAGEQETRKALAQGQGRTFRNADEAIRWLLSDDA